MGTADPVYSQLVGVAGSPTATFSVASAPLVSESDELPE